MRQAITPMKIRGPFEERRVMRQAITPMNFACERD
jgi:hypothetical protein